MWRPCTDKSLSVHNFFSLPERQRDAVHFFPLFFFSIISTVSSCKNSSLSLCFCTNTTLCVRKILQNQLGKFHRCRSQKGGPAVPTPPGSRCLLMHSPNDKSVDRRRRKEEHPGTWRHCPFNFLLIYGQDGCVCAASLILTAREA